MTKSSIQLLSTTIIVIGLFTTGSVGQTTLTIEPNKDNTLFFSPTGSISDGVGPHFYIGNTRNGDARRALVAFDVARDVPAGSTIESVELSVNVSNVAPGSGSQPASLHRLTADWGEGTSNSGSPGGRGAAATTDDATWLHRFFDTDLWATAGGDFVATASASIDINQSAAYTWSSTSQLVADVQGWLDDPSSSFGWIILGNESADMTAKRIDSRESTNADFRPKLTIVFQVATAVEDQAGVPSAVALRSSYPNPFTEKTTIPYDVATPRFVTLRVFDTLGRQVGSLAEGWHPAGSYEAVFGAGDLPTGVYFFRIESGDVIQYRQAVLVR